MDNLYDYVEALRFRASRLRLSQKDLADMIGLCPSTLNARLNNPEQMRLWELQKLSEVIEKTEKETGKIWKPKGGAVPFEGIV